MINRINLRLLRLTALAALALLAFPAAPVSPASPISATGTQIKPATLNLDGLAAQNLPWRDLAPGLELLEFELKKSRTADGRILLNVAPFPAPLPEQAGNPAKRQPAARDGLQTAPQTIMTDGRHAAIHNGQHAELAVLRTDPAQVEYTLHLTSEDGERLSLRERAGRHGLFAAINAGMYLPDNLTNTGYLRSAGHINNGRVVKNFGAFFLAGPRKSGLPPAALLEKNQLGDKLNEKIADYDLVAQNYRLTSAGRDILWPEAEEAFSISALGRDTRGRILFIACETPLSPPDFARLILALPLEANLLMYLEGGSQAGLAVLIPPTAPVNAPDGQAGRAVTDKDTPLPDASLPDAASAGFYKVWSGRHAPLRLNGLGGFGEHGEARLPNVLGVRTKK